MVNENEPLTKNKLLAGKRNFVRMQIKIRPASSSAILMKICDVLLAYRAQRTAIQQSSLKSYLVKFNHMLAVSQFTIMKVIRLLPER